MVQIGAHVAPENPNAQFEHTLGTVHLRQFLILQLTVEHARPVNPVTQVEHNDEVAHN
jgi:hypothetical protein